MATEIATAYVSLTTSAKGLIQDIVRDFEGLQAPAGKSGDDAGAGFLGSFGSKIKAGAVAAGAAAGALIVKGFTDSVDREMSSDLLAAQINLGAEQQERAAKIAGELYANAYGESLEEVNAALRGVHTNIGELGTFSRAELESMGAKALDLSKIMGEDVGRVTRGVGQLMRNGLAKDATEAFDIITAASQRLPAEFQGELIETIEEYSADFRQLGLDGPAAMGAISAAVQAGARNTDLAADALREFSIRALDGSETTRQGFARLGLDAEAMAAKIAAGGPAASEALSEVIGRLRELSPTEQELAGVELFGTRYEELGIAAISAMDPATAALTDFTGAAERAGDTLNDNTGTAIEAFKRRAMAGLGAAADAVRGYGQELRDTFREGGLEAVADKVGTDVENLVNRVGDALTTHGPVIARKALAAGRGLVEWVLPQVPPMLERLGQAVSAAGEWLLNEGAPIIADKLKAWAEAFASWVGENYGPYLAQLGGLLARLGEWIVTDALPFLAQKLLEWNVAFYSWLGTDVFPNLLTKLGELLSQLGAWITGTALPWLGNKSGEWIDAFIRWAADIIPQIPVRLMGFLLAVAGWVATTAAPWIIEHGVKLGLAMMAWITDTAIALPGRLLDISLAIADWIINEAVPWVAERALTFVDAFLGWIPDTIGKLPGALEGIATEVLAFVGGLPDRIRDGFGVATEVLLEVGADVVRGLWDGLQSMAGWIKDKVTGFVDDILPGPVKNVLGISSPSKVFHGIGENTMLGLERGIRARVPMVVAAAQAAAQAVSSTVAGITAELAYALSGGYLESGKSWRWIGFHDARSRGWTVFEDGTIREAPGWRVPKWEMEQAFRDGWYGATGPEFGHAFAAMPRTANGRGRPLVVQVPLAIDGREFAEATTPALTARELARL